MSRSFEFRLRAYADLIVQVGLNLQPGQRLLISEPYELHGVDPDSFLLVEAVKTAAVSAGGSSAVEVIWSDPVKLRRVVERRDWRGLARLAADNAQKMNDFIERGDALLFLSGSQPAHLDGLPPMQVAEARRMGSEYFQAIARQLGAAQTNWTAAPAPSPVWAKAVFPELAGEKRLAALWDSIFDRMHLASLDESPGSAPCDGRDNLAVVAWSAHLRRLAARCDALNSRRLQSIHFVGEGTNLTLSLPAEHRWCTAGRRTSTGVRFVANLPTEEVFTLPDRSSATGVVRVAGPVAYGGELIEGVELHFSAGKVTKASARNGEALLHAMLTTDEGASRLGEVALVDRSWPANGPLSGEERLNTSPDLFLLHPLLDENARHHIALGDSYDFCLTTPAPNAANRSLIHIDLPVAATANLLP